MNFEDLLNQYTNQSEENPLPDDFADQLRTAHLATHEPFTEKISQLEQENGALDAKVKVYAVKNFDLTMNQPIKAQGDVVESNEESQPRGLDDVLRKAGL